MDIQPQTKLNSMATDAGILGNYDKVIELVNLGANDLNQIAIASANTSNPHSIVNRIVSELILLGANDLETIGSVLAMNGNPLSLSVTPPSSLNYSALNSVIGDKVNILKAFISLGANNFDKMFYIAKSHNSYNSLNFLKQNYPVPFDLNLDFEKIEDEDQ